MPRGFAHNVSLPAYRPPARRGATGRQEWKMGWPKPGKESTKNKANARGSQGETAGAPAQTDKDPDESQGKARAGMKRCAV